MYYIQWGGTHSVYQRMQVDTGNDPREFTKKNIQTFKRQIKRIRFSYDWDREVNTTDPEYYKWTQWILFSYTTKVWLMLMKLPNQLVSCIRHSII